MKKILFLLLAVVAFSSCSTEDYYKEYETPIVQMVEKSYQLNPEYSYEDIVNMSREVLATCMINPELIVPDDVNYDDLDSMIEAIFCLEKQSVFGDTIEESWCYEEWHKMIIRTHNCIFDEENSL